MSQTPVVCEHSDTAAEIEQLKRELDRQNTRITQLGNIVYRQLGWLYEAINALQDANNIEAGDMR